MYDREGMTGKRLLIIALTVMILSLGMTMFISTAAATPGTVTNFIITPDTGTAGALSAYNAMVNTTGFSTLNITIPAGFEAVAPAPTSGGVQIANIEVYNATGTHGYITITANALNPQNKIDVTAGTEGVKLTATGIAVDYTAGAITSIARTAFGYSAAVNLTLPTNPSNGSLNISVPAGLTITNVSITIGQFVQNPADIGNYNFIARADGEPEGKVATVTIGKFTITPDTGTTGAVSAYNATVNTTGFSTLNITIPAGFEAVVPGAGEQIAKIDVYNATGTHGYITITANATDPQNKIDVTATATDASGTISLSAKGIAVNYTAGETTSISRTYKGYSAAVNLTLPTGSSNGSLNISVPAVLNITNGSISIGRFVRNPAVEGDYLFTANGLLETVHIVPPAQWFTITPENNMAGATSAYIATVNTTGFSTLNITIPAGFEAVVPGAGEQIAKIDVYNATGTQGYITITANATDPQNKIDVTAGTEGVELTAKGIAVNYTAGETTSISRTYKGYSAAVNLTLPTDSSNGSLNISVPAVLNITNGSISIGRFVRNPADAGDYLFTADGMLETVRIVAPTPTYRVSISSNITSQSVEMNETASYLLTIRNTGNKPDMYTLSASSEPGINASLNQSSVTIAAENSTNIILNVRGSTPREDYITIITASSLNASASIEVKTSVIKALSFSVDTSLRSVSVNDNATYIITLNNTGNIQHTYNLTKSGSGAENGTLNVTTDFDLSAGQSQAIELNVTSTAEGFYVVTVTANTTTAGNVQDQASITTTTIVSAAPLYGVALSVDKLSQFVNETKNASYILTIKNTGNRADTFNLTLINPRADTATLSLSPYITANLSAGGSETVLLNVSDAEGGTYEVKVIAESQNDPSKKDSITTTTYVLSYGVVITADSTSKTAYVGNSTTYSLTVKNTGNTGDTFNLALSSQTGLDYASLSNSSLTLAAGAAGEVTLSVNAYTGGTYWARVNATSQGNSSKSASVTVTTTFQLALRYGVDMTISPTSKEVERNEAAVYTVSVINTGNKVDTYNITATPVGTIGTGSLTISPGGTASTTLTVNRTDITTYTSIVTAASSNASVTKSVSTTVIPAVSLKATPTSRALYLGNESTFTLTIKNIGTMSHTYNLSVTNTSDTAVLSTSSVSLAKGISADVILRMNDSDPGIYTATVTATDSVYSIKTTSVLVTTSYQIKPAYGVDLVVDPTTQTIKVGRDAVYLLTVTNLGNQKDIFNLTLINPRADFATLTKTVTSELDAGSSETVLLNVRDAKGGTYEVKVIAESQHDPSKQDSITTTTNVLRYGVVITADSPSKTAYVGNYTTYILTVKNTGNTADTFNLALSYQTGLVASLSTGSLTLATGANGEVTLSVNASTVGTYWAQVNATSQGNSSKSDSIKVNTTFQLVPKDGVDMIISPASKNVERNEAAVYTVSVINTGNRVDTYTITRTLGTLGTSTLTILPGGTASTTLTVSGTEIKTYTAVIKATSQNDRTKTKTTSVSTTVIPAVSIKATPASKTLLIGNASTFTLTIKNIGTMSHTYSLSVTKTSDKAVLSAPSVSLAQGDSAVITLTMNNSAAGMYTAVVTATDSADTSKKASITVSTLYLEAPVYGVDLRVDEITKTIEPGKYALYLLTVKNLGNTQDTFTLSISNETTATLTKAMVSLDKSGTVGDTATVELNVTSDKIGEYAVNVRAVSLANSRVSDFINTTTKVAGTFEENILNSNIDELSTIINSTIIRSTITRSLITNSTITDSEITDCSIYNSMVNDTVLEDIGLDENADVNAGNITSGKITIADITYEIFEDTAISEIVTGSDEEDSSVSGAVDGTTTITSENTDSAVTIGNDGSYVGGTLTAHKSTVPPSDVSSFGLLGGYVNFEVSDNIKESLNWVNIRLTYDPADVPSDRSESDLRLQYYDTTTNRWESLNGTDDPAWCYGAGVDTVNNYVWANVSHFSVFAIIAYSAAAPAGGGAAAPIGGGGAAVAAAPMNVPVDPATGAVTSATTLSVDGATLTIPVGTIVKDAEGNPLSTSITMLYTPTTAERVGAITAYEFGPSGTTFVPPIDLVIAYDPANIPAGFSESDLVIRMWDGTTWIDFDTTIDTVAYTATAKVSHFTVFALFAAPPVAPTPIPVVTPTPPPPVTPTPTPAPPFPVVPLVAVIAIVVVVIIVAVAYVVLRRRR
jgi:uncharacterized membrane protein/tRNA(Leu) C34 or U34 (ribose-2'-O)-methylase TrmL